MTVIDELKAVYSQLADPRIDRNKKHPFISLIFIVLCSALAGIDDWVGMEDYCEANFDFFQSTSISGGVPSHDTIGRVMSRIDISSFQEDFVTFTKLLANQIESSR